MTLNDLLTALLSISGNGHLTEHREAFNSLWKVKPKARRGLFAELKRHVAPDKVFEKIEKEIFAESPEQKK